MNLDKETGIQIKVGASFQFMYDFKTGVQSNPDAGNISVFRSGVQPSCKGHRYGR